jgi:ElaB/YqjD/DUF883 family membrane-anchored ribosome-binding protein
MAEEHPVNQRIGNQGLRGQGGEAWEAARERMQVLKQDTDRYVRQNPTKAVVAALAIGFVLGMMRRR